jgi:hypothetical protein
MGVVYCSLLWRDYRSFPPSLCCPFGHRELVTLNCTLRRLISPGVSVASGIQSLSLEPSRFCCGGFEYENFDWRRALIGLC